MLCLIVKRDNTLAVSGQAPCPESSLVALTLSELHTETASPWRLTLAEGGLIAAAVMGVWAVAFSLRAIRSALNSADPE